MQFNIKNNHLFVGRGTTALYLILAKKFRDCEIIVPANICYSVIFAVLYSGNVPRFADVSEDYSGNMSLENLENVVTEKTAAIVFPHMYGNVSSEIFKVKDLCT